MNKHTVYKVFFAVVCIMLLLTENFRNIFIVAGYYVNQPSYAANCVNKNKPQLHCNGKCQLQKKLNEDNNKDKQAPVRGNELQTGALSSKTFFATLNVPPQKIITTKYYDINCNRTVDKSFRFFHPPQNFFM